MAVATPSTKAQKSAIARESRQKARVFLAGRTKTSLEAVAKHITAGGGEARTAAIDALDDSGVNEYIDGIAKQTGRVDIVFDAAGPLAKQYGNGKMAVDLPIEEFMVPLATMVKSRPTRLCERRPENAQRL